MFKKVIVLAAMLLMCGFESFAQSNPGYKRVTAATDGTVLVLNASPAVEPTVSRKFNLVSTEGEFTATFWKYDHNGISFDTKLVAFQGVNSASDSLAVKTNVIYPVELKCDFILLKGVSAPVEVDIYWYQ